MALKCQQFGVFETQPGRDEDNWERLRLEIRDMKVILYALEQCFDLNSKSSFEEMQAKFPKLKYYAALAYREGQLESHANVDFDAEDIYPQIPCDVPIERP